MAKPTASKTLKKTVKKAAKSTADKQQYDKPELRDRLKTKIIAGEKGGRAGQWSARKAQLLASEYEKAGGGYNGPKKAAQKHLDQWTEEKWHTADGKKAIQGKSTARYLPDKAWNDLTPAEKQATDAKKKKASKSGTQFVKNTKRAAAAGKKARK